MTPGADSSEFKTVIAGILATVTSALASPSAVVQCTAIAGLSVIVAAYAVSRGLAKCGHTNGKPPAPPA